MALRAFHANPAIGGFGGENTFSTTTTSSTRNVGTKSGTNKRTNAKLMNNDDNPPYPTLAIEKTSKDYRYNISNSENSTDDDKEQRTESTFNIITSRTQQKEISEKKKRRQSLGRPLDDDDVAPLLTPRSQSRRVLDALHRSSTSPTAPSSKTSLDFYDYGHVIKDEMTIRGNPIPSARNCEQKQSQPCTG